MKRLIYPFIFLLSLTSFSQEESDEFMATFIGDKEAFLSSKTGEFVFREHDKTVVSELRTTESGTVIYTDRKTHAVKKGETLSSIAKKHDISIAELKKQNKMKNVNLSIGRELKIAKKYVVNSSKPVVNQAEGKIIARLAPGQMPGGMTPPDLPPDAMPGNTINLVTDNSKPQTAQTVEEKVETLNDDGTVTHVVKSGETLFAIARKYKVSIKDVKETNKLALNTLSPGQKLKIKVYNPEAYNQNKEPVTANITEEAQKEKGIVEDTKVVVEEKTESVKDEVSKDVVNDVANALGDVIEDVKEDTEEEEEEEEAKEEIKDVETVAEDIKEAIPSEVVEDVLIEKDEKEEKINGLIEKYSKKEGSTTSDSGEKMPNDSDAKGKTHIVKKGESLWAISRKYKMTVKELSVLNNLKNNNLSIGQELKVK